MFRRIVFSACIAGVVVGLLLTGIQSWRVIPLVFEAETYETVAPNPGHGDSAHHGHDAWAPEDGWERTGFTALANVLTAIGFGLLLGAIFSLRDRVDWYNGMLWGLGGFAAFFAAPALGLTPELPGTLSADLEARQAWWIATVCATAAGLSLIAFKRPWGWKLAGAGLLIVPFLVGAPHPEVAGGSAPRALADAFVLNTAVTNGIFWILLGGLTAFTFKRFR